MSENSLAKNIAYYRKKKGLSQEKLSEYMGVSRQAVTKWESDVSKPSSDHLIRLAQLFEVDVDMLMGDEGQEKPSPQIEITMGKTPWIFIGISVLCILIYGIRSGLSGNFSTGTFVLMFVLGVPIQLFMHAYFSYAIKSSSFAGIAGFDGQAKYNIREVKKLLAQINLHIQVLSVVYVFLLCVINCMDEQIKWLNAFLMITYLVGFVCNVGIINYRMTDKIYIDECEKKRTKRSVPITAIYVCLLLIGIGMTIAVFEIKGIENNTTPAMKCAGLLVLSAAAATGGFLFENNRIKKENPEKENYKISKIGIMSLIGCVILYGAMCFV